MEKLPWLLLLTIGVLGSARGLILPGLFYNICNKYFTFPTETDLNKLQGEWVTLGSTRKVFPCHRFTGEVEDSRKATVKETWRRTGFLGTTLDYEVVDEVTANGESIEVTQARFAALLKPGRLAVASLGDRLFLAQCNNFLFFSVPSFTILARNYSSDPRGDVLEVYSHFRVPRTSPLFYITDHNHCNRTEGPAAIVRDFELQRLDSNLGNERSGFSRFYQSPSEE